MLRLQASWLAADACVTPLDKHQVIAGSEWGALERDCTHQRAGCHQRERAPFRDPPPERNREWGQVQGELQQSINFDYPDEKAKCSKLMTARDDSQRVQPQLEAWDHCQLAKGEIWSGEDSCCIGEWANLERGPFNWRSSAQKIGL